MDSSTFFHFITEIVTISVFEWVRYGLLAGFVFLLLYVWKKKKYWYAKIQQRLPHKKIVLLEIKYSITTVIIFGVVLREIWANKNIIPLRDYSPIDKYGYPYYFLSIVLMIFVHDAYFYWTHRFLHWKPVFKLVHKVHHKSFNPTPFSGYCFHPIEALIQVVIIPLIVYVIPYHYSALAFFSIYTLTLSVMGHSGYEFFPVQFMKNKIVNWHNTATHHNMHHIFVKYNYGLYFNIWDKMMKTNHPKYKEYFDDVKKRDSKLSGGDNPIKTSEVVKTTIPAELNEV